MSMAQMCPLRKTHSAILPMPKPRAHVLVCPPVQPRFQAEPLLKAPLILPKAPPTPRVHPRVPLPPLQFQVMWSLVRLQPLAAVQYLEPLWVRQALARVREPQRAELPNGGQPSGTGLAVVLIKL